MTDNVAISAGLGTPIATDDCSGSGAGGHAQITKLAISADGDRTLIPADTTNGLGVDVKRMVATVTEDGPSSGGETSLLVAGVRNDAAVAKTTADGDFSNIAVDSAGRVGVCDLGGSLTVDTGGGSFAVQDSEKLADNAGFTDGTTKVQPAGYIFDETPGTALTENDVGAARMDSKRALVGVIEDESTRGRRATVTSANALKVDGSAVTQPVSFSAGTTSIAKAEDAASADADVGVPAMAVRKATPANTSGADGRYEMLQVNSGRLWTWQSRQLARVSVSVPGISTTPPYTSGDQVGTVMTFSVAPYNNGTGRIVSALLTNRFAGQNAAYELWLFQNSPTSPAGDNNQWDFTDANLEAANLLGVVQFLNYFNTSSNQMSNGMYCGMPLGGAALPFVTSSGTTNTYGFLVTRSAPQPNSSSDLVVSLLVEQD